MEKMTHAEIDRFALRFEIEDIALDENSAKYKRVNAIMQCLIANPKLKGPSGGNLTFEIFDFLLEVAEARSLSIETEFPNFLHALKRDGYVIDNNELTKSLPDNVDLPSKESELNLLLARLHFNTPKGHLEQAIKAHTRGDWASTNAQLRTFVESLFDSIADQLEDGSNPLLQTSHQRREYLATLTPPFLLISLNEWEIGGTGGFMQGFWRRLHPAGSHPGLSGEEDCTFRLHIVILVAHHLLRRLAIRLEGQPAGQRS